MFNKDFFPTPATIIRKMVDPYYKNLQGKLILEPSAGKGDIALHIKQSDYRNSIRVHTCEVEPELQAILQGKDLEVKGGDFLTAALHHQYDYIFANPPFSAGAKHLLKMWEIARNTTIVCLLNKETYDNPFSKERELLKSIIDQHGTVEYLGQCFKGSERDTNVEVIMVTLVKTTTTNEHFNLNGFEQKEDKEFDDLGNLNSLEVTNFFEQTVNRYEATIKAYEAYILAQDMLKKVSPISLSEKFSRNDSYDIGHDYNTFVDKFTAKMWRYIFTKSKFDAMMTEATKDEFMKKFEQQQKVAITRENLANFMEILIVNRGSIMNDCILNIFDDFTKYYKENRAHVEGWKTNDKWKVNQKVILPRVRCEDYGTPTYEAKRMLDDIDKVMCYIVGCKMGDIDSIVSVLKSKEIFDDNGKKIDVHYAQTNVWYESTFFECKVFKKGTLHLKFKDEQLWRFFNIKACELRGWPLPAAEKRKYKGNLMKI